MKTNIIGCNCVSEFQDKQYGKGSRLGNLTKPGNYRCTVCGRETVTGSVRHMAHKVYAHGDQTKTMPVVMKLQLGIKF